MSILNYLSRIIVHYPIPYPDPHYRTIVQKEVHVPPTLGSISPIHQSSTHQLDTKRYSYLSEKLDLGICQFPKSNLHLPTPNLLKLLSLPLNFLIKRFTQQL